jgi:hypothetical protein
MNDEGEVCMMHRDARLTNAMLGQRQWPKVALGVLGGVLYIVAALVVMQVAFLFWIGAW